MKKRKEQKELSSIMTRRMLMIGGGQFVLGAMLVGRLYQLQISQPDNYRRLSDRNQFDKRLVQAPRGRLLDVRDRLLAGNSEVFELRMLPSRVSDKKQWLNRVGKIIRLRLVRSKISSKLFRTSLISLKSLSVPILHNVNYQNWLSFHLSWKGIFS